MSAEELVKLASDLRQCASDLIMDKVEDGTVSTTMLYEAADEIERLSALAAKQDGAEPVAWRVLVTKNGKTYNEYTERLPFDPLEGSGVIVRSEPEPLYSHSPTNER